MQASFNLCMLTFNWFIRIHLLPPNVYLQHNKYMYEKNGKTIRRVTDIYLLHSNFDS